MSVMAQPINAMFSLSLLEARSSSFGTVNASSSTFSAKHGAKCANKDCWHERVHIFGEELA